jgi:hypothetical protein
LVNGEDYRKMVVNSLDIPGGDLFPPEQSAFRVAENDRWKFILF